MSKEIKIIDKPRFWRFPAPKLSMSSRMKKGMVGGPGCPPIISGGSAIRSGPATSAHGCGLAGEQRRNCDDGTSQKPLRWGLSLCTQLEPLSQHPERQTNDVAKWLTEAVAFLLAVAQFPRGLENRRRVCRSVVRRLPPTMATNHFVSVEQLLDLGSASLPP